MRLIDADEFKKNAIKRFHCDPLVTGLSDNDSDNLSFVIDEEPTVDPKGLQETTTFDFADCCENSAWVCDRCGGGIKGFTSPEVMGYNFCPYCGAEIEVGK